jgi:DNA-binding MarR family transcriptional regulator
MFPISGPFREEKPIQYRGLPSGRRFRSIERTPMTERETVPPAPQPNDPKRLPPLLRKAWYGLNQTFRQRIAHLGVTPDQFSIMRWLAEGDPAGLTQREITDLMSSDPNTITSTLSRMEKAGLVTRKPHESDGRAHRVILLEEGRKAFDNARKIALDLQIQVLAALPEERREGFLAELEVVGNSCAALLESGATRARGGE